MALRKWDNLPDNMRLAEVKPYYDVLESRRLSLALKRVLDYCVAAVLLIVLSIPIGIIAIIIKADSEGTVFYRQERVTAYGRVFRIHKFRTMVSGADRIGEAVTTAKDGRITKVGRRLRKLRLDEIPQIIDVLSGNMSFVGTRPEALKYVSRYEPEYMATLLLPAGITSEASIRFKDEEKLLEGPGDVNDIYMNKVLPEKMKINLKSIRGFSIRRDIATAFRTVLAVLGKEYR